MYKDYDMEYEQKSKCKEKEESCCSINIFCEKSPFEKYSFYDKFHANVKEKDESKNDSYETSEMYRKPCWDCKCREKECVTINIFCEGKKRKD